MVIALAVGILVLLLVVRELVRALLHGTFRRSAIYELVTPVSLRRRVLAIAGGLVATVACVIAIAYVSFGVYGDPSGEARYRVDAVIPGSAAEGILQEGDRIDTFDGEHLRVRRGPG